MRVLCPWFVYLSESITCFHNTIKHNDIRERERERERSDTYSVICDTSQARGDGGMEIHIYL